MSNCYEHDDCTNGEEPDLAGSGSAEEQENTGERPTSVPPEVRPCGHSGCDDHTGPETPPQVGNDEPISDDTVAQESSGVMKQRSDDETGDNHGRRPLEDGQGLVTPWEYLSLVRVRTAYHVRKDASNGNNFRRQLVREALGKHISHESKEKQA